MAFHITLARVLEKAQPHIRTGELLGMRPGVAFTAPVVARFRQPRASGGFSYSVIGAALPDKFHVWLIENGKAGLSLATLLEQEHISAPAADHAALMSIDSLDFMRLKHIRDHGLDLWGQKLTESLIGMVALSDAQAASLVDANARHAEACERLGTKPHASSAIIGKADRASLAA